MTDRFFDSEFRTEVLKRIKDLKAGIDELRGKQAIQEFYTTRELAQIVGRGEWRVREWCRLRRINARKKNSGHGRSFEWAISHEELLRYRAEGLLPLRIAKGEKGGEAG
jgi:hypothetical protein